MEELKYPINETSMHYFYSTVGEAYWDVFVVGQNTPVKRFSAGSILEIRQDNLDYLIKELTELPTDAEMVSFLAENGVLAFSASVQNREGFGIEDFRDCARSHYWDLGSTADFSFFVHLLPGDAPHLLLGCPAELAPIGYSEYETCGVPG